MIRHDPVLKLNQKPHTLYGIVSFIMVIISVILVIITITIAASKNGMTESQILLVGTLEWVSAMITLTGFGIALIGEGAIEMERLFVHISLLLHFVGLIYHGFVIFFGFIA